jgi:choline dehydrogenase-like flavoprotein
VGVKFETINVPPEVAASRLPGAGKRLSGYLERLDRLAVWAVALRADAEGTVRPSRIMGDMVRYTLTRHDMERLRSGVAVAAKMHFLAGAEEVLPGIFGLPDSLTSMDQIKLIEEGPLDAAAYSLLCTHLFGGCRAAADPSAGVVDGKLKVHGVDGLYVMDASVFPTNTGVNPQHSIMALSHVAATRLAGA